MSLKLHQNATEHRQNMAKSRKGNGWKLDFQGQAAVSFREGSSVVLWVQKISWIEFQHCRFEGKRATK